jgi:hypothetical protein
LRPDAPRWLPRFTVSRWAGRYWLDRHGAGRDQAQAVGPWRDRRKAKRAAHQFNRCNRRCETGRAFVQAGAVDVY